MEPRKLEKLAVTSHTQSLVQRPALQRRRCDARRRTLRGQPGPAGRWIGAGAITSLRGDATGCVAASCLPCAHGVDQHKPRGRGDLPDHHRSGDLAWHGAAVGTYATLLRTDRRGTAPRSVSLLLSALEAHLRGACTERIAGVGFLVAHRRSRGTIPTGVPPAFPSCHAIAAHHPCQRPAS